MVVYRKYLAVIVSFFFFSAVVFYHSASWTVQQVQIQHKLEQVYDVDEQETRPSTGTGCGCRQMEPPVKSEKMISTCSYEADLRKNGQEVVSYSLFGDTNQEVIKRRYFSSLKQRADRVAQVYPGWIMRIYHNFSLSQDDELCQIYCCNGHVDLCDINKLRSVELNDALTRQLNPRMWRFLAMIDPLVDIFMSRDIDSEIIDREVAAVQQWLNSNWTFHVMRDHPSHGGFMLAGLWGAKNYLRRTLIQGMGHSMVWTSQNDRYETDQRRLDLVVWPFATFDVMAHDSYFCNNWFISLAQMVPSYAFPTQRVGRNYTGYDVVRTDIADHIQKCPLDCRPRMHKNWEYC